MMINIIPAVGLPRTTGFYTYSVPADLAGKIKVGQIIEVNFRNKNIQGLIIGIEKNKKPKYKLKKINKILYPQPLVTQRQIKLIKYISEHYGVAQSIVVKSMLPEIPKRIKNHELRIMNIKKNIKYKKELIWYQDESELIKLLKEKIKNSKGQVLILAPEIDMIDKLINKLDLPKNKVIKNYAGIAKIKFLNNWLGILSGKAKIIIGTKISVLLPFSNLSDIVIYNEHDWNHKQSDINPRFDARKVAEWLAKEHGCGLTLATPAPSVEQYHLNTKTLKYPSASLRAGLNTKINIKIVDLRKEREKGNYTFLSDELMHNIKANLAENKRVFIFHNRKGLANFVSCNDCGYVFKCPECEILLAYHIDDKKLHCHYCNYNQDSLPFCPNCQGPNIKFKSQGVEKIGAELQKEFGDIKILTLEKTSASKHFNILTFKHHNIVIGTEFVMNKINFSQFNLISFTNFDQLLNWPDFRASEKAYQLFYEIKSQTQKSDFIIQTYDPENIVLKSIQQNKPELFYETELTNRQELNYPPFVKIIKLIYKSRKSAKGGEKNAVYNSKKIVQSIKNKIKNIEIIGPLENYPKKVYGKFKYNIIIKMPLDFDAQKIIKLVPNDFVIDVGPERLI